MVQVALVSLGCAKNTVDSEYILGLFRNAGFQITSDPARAVIIIINTCGFLQAARLEAVDAILEMSIFKSTGVLKKLVVTGCMADRDREIIREITDQVDLFVSPFKLKFIVDAIKKSFSSDQDPLEVHSYGKEMDFQPAEFRENVTPPSYSYVKIGDGCDNRCAYCRIPYLRGGYRSKHPADVLGEVRSLVDRKFKEIILISQDNTQYGVDFNELYGLTEIVRECCTISELHWLRLMYTYPFKIPDSLLDLMRKESKICRYLDIPLQHVNGRVLRAMNRKGNAVKIRNWLEKIKLALPDVTLRSTLITGYPAEDKAAFKELKLFVTEGWIDHLGVFCYSPEPNTHAIRMFGLKQQHLGERRRQDLMLRQQENVFSKNRKRVGQVVEVLVDGRSEKSDWTITRMASQAPDVDTVVLVPGNYQAGSLIKVKIVNTLEYDLVGQVLGNEE